MTNPQNDDWRKIEGFINEKTADIVQSFVHAVPENGWIVEVGCYKGRQSALIASSKKESVRLSCIDPFPDTHIAFDDSQTYRGYTITDWSSHMHRYPNVEAVRGFSPFPISFLQFSRSPDLLILNIDRAYESLVFWEPHLKPDCPILIHTYSEEHDRILKQIQQYQAEFKGIFSSETAENLTILRRRV